MESIIEIEKKEKLINFAGVNDENIRLFRKYYPDISIIPRGSTIKLISDNSATVEKVSLLITYLLKIVDEYYYFNKSNLDYILSVSKKNNGNIDFKNIFYKSIPVLYKNKSIVTKTINQHKFIESILSHDITFGIGPAGTGKTFLSVAAAVNSLKEKIVKRIVLVRPVVEAGEKLGFLPGDISAKIDPYLRPLYDSLHETIDEDTLQNLFSHNIIEIAPLAYMRGRTLNNAFIILDEAQNSTIQQMKMFLTRIGKGSKAVITGDITQIDLTNSSLSGLIHAQKILRNISDIDFIRFDEEDVLRHKLIKDIIDAYTNNGTK